ncbi:MAG: glycerophosphodiester phosphodiesterase [Candidatus Hodarchaeota archaeon]
MNKNVITWGHRGSTYGPENTILSFSKAIEMGVDGIELDVYKSKDGHMMVTHADAIEIGDTRYRISKLPLEELKKVKFEDDQEMPTLDEVFTRFERATNKTLLYSVDIRDLRSFEDYFQVLESHDVLDRVYTCFDSRYSLKKMQRMHPELIKILSLQGGGQAAIEEIQKVDASTLKVINLSSEHLTSEIIEMIHKKNLLSFVWECNDKETIKKFVELGVDGIYSDYPDILVNVVKDHSS